MRTSKAAAYSAVVSLYFGLFYFGIGTLMTLSQHQSMGKFLADFLIVMVTIFGLFTFLFKDFSGAFDKINTPRDADKNPSDSEKNGQS